MSSFVFISCQVGAEKALKADLEKHHPELAFAFSRPGFVTFKASAPLDFGQPLQSYFARSVAQSVGSIKESTDRIAEAIGMFPNHPYRHLHVWQRDTHLPGDRGFEPFHTDESLTLGKEIKSQATDTPLAKVAINRTAKNGDYVADLVVIEPGFWFVGWHQASSIPSRWPGGVPPIRRPEQMVSRTYLKMQDALRWSRLPIEDGDLCIELGSSPGGSCQALLERGLRVIGVDPAVMAESVVAHPNFTHVRARAADLKRKEFADTRWLMMDANLAPQSTLEALEHIVTNKRVNIQGMLITLKLLDPNMVDKMDEYLDRIFGWGFRHIRARQLAFNRREICVLATKNKARSRLRRSKP